MRASIQTKKQISHCTQETTSRHARETPNPIEIAHPCYENTGVVTKRRNPPGARALTLKIQQNRAQGA